MDVYFFQMVVLIVRHRQRQIIFAIQDILKREYISGSAASGGIAGPAIGQFCFIRLQSLIRKQDIAGQRDILPRGYRHGEAAILVRFKLDRGGVASRAGYFNTAERQTGKIRVLEHDCTDYIVIVNSRTSLPRSFHAWEIEIITS